MAETEMLQLSSCRLHFAVPENVGCRVPPWKSGQKLESLTCGDGFPPENGDLRTGHCLPRRLPVVSSGSAKKNWDFGLDELNWIELSLKTAEYISHLGHIPKKSGTLW